MHNAQTCVFLVWHWTWMTVPQNFQQRCICILSSGVFEMGKIVFGHLIWVFWKCKRQKSTCQGMCGSGVARRTRIPLQRKCQQRRLLISSMGVFKMRRAKTCVFLVWASERDPVQQLQDHGCWVMFVLVRLTSAASCLLFDLCTFWVLHFYTC